VLLHELAHARRPARTSTTVAACWADERATEQAAHTLADTWGDADLFPPEVRDARLDAIDERCGWEQELILLVGLDHAGLAAAAYRAIRRLAHARQWSDDTWQMALLGAAEDDAANQAVLLFDRSPLLGSYSLDRTGETGLEDAALPVDGSASPANCTTTTWSISARGGMMRGRGHLRRVTHSRASSGYPTRCIRISMATPRRRCGRIRVGKLLIQEGWNARSPILLREMQSLEKNAVFDQTG
jgi:hypothetical protein